MGSDQEDRPDPEIPTTPKRKNKQDKSQQPNKRRNDNGQCPDDQEDELTLSLSFGPPRPKKPSAAPPRLPPPSPPVLSSPPLLLRPPQEIVPHPPLPTQTLTLDPHLVPHPPSALQLSPSHPLFSPLPPPTGVPSSTTSAAPSSTARPPRARRNPAQAPREGKSNIVPPPFPWATNKRATVQSLDTLLSKGIKTITGEVQCKKCEKQYEMGFDLREKFMEVGTFIVKHKSSMHERAPNVWMNPVLPKCRHCMQENSAKPVFAEKKKEINWLFLLLGQMLGCCTLEQLKYFCKHTRNHRTGAKDRVLFLAYLGLCKQLDPNGPFDR